MLFSFGIDFIHEFLSLTKFDSKKCFKIFTLINSTRELKKLGINLAN